MRSVNPARINERLAQKRFEWILPQLLLHSGVLCDLVKVKESEERDVYGHYAGQNIEDMPETTLLIAGLPVSDFRAAADGHYGQGYFTDSEACYADYPDLEEGDVLRVHETDVQFIVTNIMAVGMHARMRRFAISSIQSGIRPDSHHYPQKLIIS